jgi:prepilin signal peptidase PulO-like enzyme (type II secretory pathway)
MPLEVRLAVICAAGLLLGGQVNRGIYRLAWNPRDIGPWSRPPENAPHRHWLDLIPLLGWWFLRRESSIHGRGYWVRPLLIELALGLGLAGLYYYETVLAANAPTRGAAVTPAVLHAQFFAHVVLITLMVVATFIDFDEQTIPDAITVYGTLAGLTIAAALPISRPLVSAPAAPPVVGLLVNHLHLVSPASWPDWLHRWQGLLIGLACLQAWWLAIIPWTWTTRRGMAKAMQYLVASIVRRATGLWLLISVLASAGVLAIWWVGGDRWESLLSSLVGMAFGGGLIWAVRVIGTAALGEEAMGFGDVTLMAMIGTFTGWQATLIIFFLAPFAAVFICITQWLLTRRKDIAFGPYLCLAALYLVVRWRPIWQEQARQVFSMGWIVPALVAACLVLMGGMLMLMRALRVSLQGSDEEASDELAAPQEDSHEGPGDPQVEE